MADTITLELPERLHQRLLNTAQATQQSLEAVILRALTIGSPPDWTDVPEEYQADLAALDRLDNDALWRVAQANKSAEDMARYDELLDRNSEGQLTDTEQLELLNLRKESERFMLCKSHAASILRWRGYRSLAA
ncbi:hypothetical protein IQ260_12780 [Leptolyngbya cf. ectocarpi LEGE 11479]|uniref:Uncharacterized protein n=1 Tax=Leptolyngbya cf. ectocarpi LEGE 11479 TaxID=1828722 RepID=A0A928ZU82_LEPEC|nr:hypothetical protein [Leptolyngbya ectocarpi]MBE9067534.1 hypothetical protein [Leptolyngbya cf. ectocarpi LEGE 11479]